VNDSLHSKMLIIVLDNVKPEKEKTKRALIFSDLFSIFVVVRSDHNEGLGKISFRSVFLILRWQKEEEGRHGKEKVSSLRMQEC
jgi:hypothetical protein